MSHLTMLMKKFIDDESGAALVEYAVIFAVILAGSLGALGLVTDQLQAVFATIQQTLTDIALLDAGAP